MTAEQAKEYGIIDEVFTTRKVAGNLRRPAEAS